MVKTEKTLQIGTEKLFTPDFWKGIPEKPEAIAQG